MFSQRLLTLSSLLVSFALAWPVTTFAQQAAAAYVVADHTTGFVLDSLNPQKKLQVGSLTKVATAMVVLDWAEAQRQELTQLATVPQSAQGLNAGGSGVGF